LRHWLEHRRGVIDMWRNNTAHPPGEFGEIREDSRYELYSINRCLRALYPDQDLLHDVEDKINEVIDRYHYSNLDFNKMPSTFVNSVFKLGEHITKGLWCENCVHDAVDYEMKRKEQFSNFVDSKNKDGWTFE
jgi:hypothetical protein